VGNTDEMKRVIFFWRALSVSKFIGNFISRRFTDKPKIIDESFIDEVFLPVSLLIK
jgi:hypothetical protein